MCLHKPSNFKTYTVLLNGVELGEQLSLTFFSLVNQVKAAGGSTEAHKKSPKTSALGRQETIMLLKKNFK